MVDLEKGSEGVNLTDKQWSILCERFGEFHQNDFAIDISDELDSPSILITERRPACLQS